MPDTKNTYNTIRVNPFGTKSQAVPPKLEGKS